MTRTPDPAGPPAGHMVALPDELPPPSEEQRAGAVPPITAPATTATAARAAWLEWRRSGVGASEVAALVRVSPWGTPYQVWLSKVEGVELDESEPMMWGTLLEPVILSEYERRTGLYVGGRQLQVTHPDRPHHLATLDGIAGDHPGVTLEDALVGVEVKNVSDRRWFEVPIYYWTQAQWQMHVTGLDEVVFAVLHAGTSLELYEVERDDDDIATLVAAVDRFWADHVLTAVPPAVVGRDLPVVKDRHGGAGEVVADEVVLSLVEQYSAAKQAARSADDLADELAANLIGRLADAGADVFVDAGGAPLWSHRATRVFNLDAAVADHPDLAFMHTSRVVDVAAFKKSLGRKGAETYMVPGTSRRIVHHTKKEK